MMILFQFIILTGVVVNSMALRTDEMSEEDSNSRQNRSTATHVIVYDTKEFDAEITKRPHFVMFHYLPKDGNDGNVEFWFNQLAEKFNTKESMKRLVLAKIVCDEFSELCQKVAPDGKTKLILYKGHGQPSFIYSGENDYENWYNFLKNNLENFEESVNDDEIILTVEVPHPKMHLVELKEEDNFESHIKTGHHFIKFYAPWCGHCQHLAPVWEELAKTFEYDDWLTVSKVDCTKLTSVCIENGVKGYPTLMFFADGKKIEEYNGARDHNSLKQFVMKQKEDFIQRDNFVVDLTEESFISGISSGAHFVMFSDRDCQPCRAFDADWNSLAHHFSDQRVTFEKIDCANHRDFCGSQMIYSYPTLVFYKDGIRLEKFDGERNINNLINFVITMKDKSAVDGILPDEVSFVLDLHSLNYLNQIENGFVFVNFLKPWCEFCKNLAPIWEELAKKLSFDQSVTIAKVDCSISDSICDRYDVKGYPTMILFYGGTIKYIYTGSHDLPSLFDYVTSMTHHIEF